MTRTKKISPFLLPVVALSLLLGCERNDRHLGTLAPSGSSVQITTVSPSIAEPLRSGDKVRLKVDVDYTLTGESGTLALVVQAADNSSIAQNIEVVTKGSGKVVMEAEFVVPDTKAIQIFIPLSAQGQSSTSTVDTRAFKVFSN